MRLRKKKKDKKIRPGQNEKGKRQKTEWKRVVVWKRENGAVREMQSSTTQPDKKIQII